MQFVMSCHVMSCHILLYASTLQQPTTLPLAVRKRRYHYDIIMANARATAPYFLAPWGQPGSKRAMTQTHTDAHPYTNISRPKAQIRFRGVSLFQKETQTC